MTEPDFLAAELALGLLDGADLLAARGRLASDPAFAAQVADWERKLTPLLDEISPAEPDPALWSRIAGALDASPPAGGEVLALRRAVRRWQWTAALSAAAALVIAVLAGPMLLTPPPETVPPAPMVASMELPATQLRLGLTWMPDRGELMVSAAGMAADGVHDHELWVVPASGKPLSLGVVVPGAAHRVQLPAALAAQLGAGATVALSVEALGGSVNGTPGPVVASAKLSST